MANKRKYPEVVGWWVYSIKVPSINKFYIGISKQQCCGRWQKTRYKGMTLEPYLDEWESMVKTVLVDNLTKEQAYQYEGNIIDALSMNNLCLNELRSGLITNDKNAYMKELYQNNTEYRERAKQQQRQYYEDNKEKVKQQSKQWQLNNKEKKQEYDKQYREDNKEKKRAYNKQYQKQRYENDVEYRERKKQQARQRRLKKKLEKQQQNSLRQR